MVLREFQHLLSTLGFCLQTANTTLRPIEIKRPRWRDLDPASRLITVRKSKTDAGDRIIPLHDEAWSAMVAMRKKGNKL